MCFLIMWRQFHYSKLVQYVYNLNQVLLYDILKGDVGNSIHCIPAEDLLPQRMLKGSWDEDKAYLIQ
jgi:hypothetical protein